ncbi:MAG: riboflavin biosynthesis protein RibD, partial [Gammaproteobacteria bacterium]|nr:riboflavin biosynthesis protein RibD [Gammaproteobacteria bacterium]
MQKDRDQIFLAEALKLAKEGLYTTHPNPRVGCLLVKDDAV